MSNVTKKNLEAKTKEWLNQISSLNFRSWDLDKSKTALLVIDMQKYFTVPGASAYLPHGEAIIPNVKSMIECFRRNRLPIVFTRHVHNPDGSGAGNMGWWWNDMIIDGSDESEIHPELTPHKDDIVIKKDRYSAFHNTELEKILKDKGIIDLIITGVMTNLCCETTARDAFNRDFHVTLLVDATGTVSEEMHVATLMNLSYGFARISTSLSVCKDFKHLG